jgi:hypothetical protein
MNGPQHYLEAERLLGLVKTGQASLGEPWSTSVLDDPTTGPTAALAAAQVHATLALTAAMAAQSQSQMYTTLPEWREVLS